MKNIVFILLFLVHPVIQGQYWTNILPFGITGEAVSFQEHNGLLYTGGGFSMLNAWPQVFGAAFDGQNWNTLGQFPLDSQMGIGPGTDGGIRAIIKSGNNLIIGGGFGRAGIFDSLNRRKAAGFDGSNWYSIYAGFPPAVYPANIEDVYALQYFQGKLFIAGQFQQFGPPGSKHIVAFDSLTGWSILDGGVSFWGPGAKIMCLAIYNNELYVGGTFSAVGSSNLPCNFIAKWNGVQWDSVGPGFDGDVRVMVVDTINNILYAGGGFTRCGADTINGIAKWNGNQWSPVGSGLDVLYGTMTMCMFNNELYAGGANYTITSQGDTLRNIYRYNGTKWVSLVGGGTNSVVKTMFVYNGNLIISGVGITSAGGATVNNFACYGNTCPTNVGIINLPASNLDFIVFPNPAGDLVSVEMKNNINVGNEEFTLQLFDPLGKKVLEKPFRGKTSFTAEKLIRGIYLVSISDAEGRTRYAGKLVLE